MKPEMEYLVKRILSNLLCKVRGNDWSKDFGDSRNGLSYDSEIVPIANKTVLF